MNLMIFRIALSFAFLALSTEGMQKPGPRPVAFSSPEFQLEEPNWRPWESPLNEIAVRKSALAKRPHVPSATVEVVESVEMDRHQRLLEFKAFTLPLLGFAFSAGHAFRTNVQMLGEFMLQDPAHPHPPSVPSVFYNNFKPPPENPARAE